jgi:hypothetical protein
MTINKAQGQTLNIAGLDVTVQCFSNGQWFIALSPITCKKNIFVLVPKGEIPNVMYPEIFRVQYKLK